MILYFSGTGNSEYIAKRISQAIKDEAINLFTYIKNNDYTPLTSSRPWIIVTPTYAWRIPRLVETWLKQTPLNGHHDIYFVLTCGSNIGNATHYLEILCTLKNMNYRGCQGIIMPENYIAMFQTPHKDEAKGIINNADVSIKKTIQTIFDEESLIQPHITIIDKISSGIVNNIFYPIFVHAKKFYTTNQCISCGLCEKVCPCQNIQIKDGKPLWGKECTHCMACISKCPTQAIEYGKHSKGLPRYQFPKD